MAFSINDITGIAGALQPGDYVDVMLTLQASALPTQTVRAGTQPTLTGTEGLPVTQLMLQNVLILQVGNWGGTGEKSGPANTITLALDRQDALALKAAREQGEIDLILRRVGDTKIVETEPVNLQYLNKRFKFNLIPPVAR
jgi:Flp pilus assembly protein CpaB